MHVEEIFIWGKNDRKTGEFRYSVTITNSPLVTQPIKMQNLHQSTCWVILTITITWLCLTRTGNYQIHECDWLKSILTAVQIFPSRPASRPGMFCSEKLQLKCKIIDCFHLTIIISVSAKNLMRKKVMKTSKLWKN